MKRMTVGSVERTGGAFAVAASEAGAEGMIAAALDYCAFRTGSSPEVIAARTAAGDRCYNSTMRYALAREIGRVLRSDPDFRQLYLEGSVLDDGASLDSDIDLILHVRERKEAFETWLARMNTGLMARFRRRFNPEREPKRLLDYHVVTDDEVAGRIGFGAHLTSAHARACRMA